MIWRFVAALTPQPFPVLGDGSPSLRERGSLVVGELRQQTEVQEKPLSLREGLSRLSLIAPAGCVGPGPSQPLRRFVGAGDLINRPYTDCCRGDISCRPRAERVAGKGLG